MARTFTSVLAILCARKSRAYGRRGWFPKVIACNVSSSSVLSLIGACELPSPRERCRHVSGGKCILSRKLCRAFRQQCSTKSNLQDAILLSRLLGDPGTTKADLPAALMAYEATRLPRTHSVVRASRENGLDFEMNGECGEDLPRVGARISELTSWISNLDPEVDIRAALSRLKELKEKKDAVA